MPSTKTIEAKLEAFRRRDARMKSAMAQQKVALQQCQDKERARLYSILGEALARYADQSPDFKLMLQQVLHSAQLRDRDRAFLTEKGWL